MTDERPPDRDEPGPGRPERDPGDEASVRMELSRGHAGVGVEDAPATDAAPGPLVDSGESRREPALSPFAELEPGSRSVLSVAFDTLTHTTADLRRASFYVGLLVLGLVAPMALLAWRLAVEIPGLAAGEQLDLLGSGVEVYVNVALIVAAVGLLVATVESRGVAISLLGARLAGRAPEPRDAVRRSRAAFWRLFWAIALANLPLLVVQGILQAGAAEVLGGESEFSVLGASLLAAVLFAPLAYVQAGVVLGDVGPVTAVRRSVGVFGARKRLAVVVALFEFGAQFVTLFGLAAGLDLVLRLTDVTGLGSGTDVGSTAVTAALIVALVFAIGTLIFTVAAIATAPQVVAFLALTHAADGLDRLGDPRSRFRWLTRPTLVGMTLAALALFAAVAALE